MDRFGLGTVSVSLTECFLELFYSRRRKKFFETASGLFVLLICLPVHLLGHSTNVCEALTMCEDKSCSYC